MPRTTAHSSRFVGTLELFFLFRSNLAPALNCDLRDDPAVRERLKPYGAQTVQYEEGLAVQDGYELQGI